MKIMKPKIGKQVTVKWSDSQMYHGQWSKEDIFETAIVLSTGFLIENSKKQIVLAGDLIETDLRRVIAIPRCNFICFI